MTNHISENFESSDLFYAAIISHCLDYGGTSVSFLCHFFSIDSVQASLFIDHLIEDGILSSSCEASLQKILISREQWETPNPDFPNRVYNAQIAFLQTQKERWESLSHSPVFCLRALSHYFFLWFIEPLPFCLCIATTSFMLYIGRNYPTNPLLLAFETIVLFIVSRFCYESVTTEKHQYKRNFRYWKWKRYLRTKWKVIPQASVSPSPENPYTLRIKHFLKIAAGWIFKPVPFLIYLSFVICFWVMLHEFATHPFEIIGIAAVLALFYVPIRIVHMTFHYIRVGWPTCPDLYHFNSLSMDAMDGHQFESFCADLLRKNGFREVEVTQASGDYGIDVLAEKDGVTYAIQCKCYSGNVGNHAVQEAHSGADFYRRMVAVVMTNSYFTKAAKETAAQTKVLLWDRNTILQMINK